MTKMHARAALRLKLISLAVASCFTTSAALANPTGANVVRGTAAIHQAGNLLQITNSPNAIINWQSFSIGANEITRFIQQSPASAVLNRVTTQNPSTILGTLQSNGRVFLINPNGILFGAGAQVDVAGLVASTLNLSDQDFLAGRLRFTDGLGKSVVNDGSIATGPGGSVYLIGSGVTNNGIIRSPQGEVVLAAGNSVELVSPGTPDLRVEIAATDNEARNLGQIISDAGRIGIYAGLITNSGSIRADSAVSEGGHILLKATKSATLKDSSVLSAQGQGGGEILVLADERVQVAGRLDASAPNGGDGGFIETSAKKVQVDSGVIITTAAPYGMTGTWLIDPADFTIASLLGDITGAVLSSNLSPLGTSVTIVSDDGLVNPNGTGAIFVNDTVSWSSVNSLTLIARGDVTVNSSVTNAGTGAIAMYAGWDGLDRQNPTVISCCSGSINLLAPISTAGTAVLVAGLGISQSAGAPISAANLLAKSGFGDIALAGATNSVGTLAGETLGSFLFTNGPSLAIGSVNSGNANIGTNGTITGVTSSGSSIVTINVTGGDLTINSNILAEAGGSHQARVTLTARDNIVANMGSIGALGFAGEGNGDSFVTMTAQSGGITLNSAQVVAAVSSGCCNTSRNAQVMMTAAGPIAINGGTVQATGADNGVGGAGGSAAVTITGNGIAVNGSVSATGGNGTSFSQAITGPGGDATVTLNGGAGGITVQGGGLARAGTGVIVGGGNGTTGGAANVALNTTGAIAVNGTVLGAAGGDGLAGVGGNANAVLTTGGDITLASNVIANGGMGTMGNGTGRIDLVFLNSGTNFVVNGQSGLIFDTITGSGFIVDGAPGILNVNLFVTGGGPAFIDPLVASMNQQADVLADQLKAGETGETEDKEKKKLPFCSS